MMKYPGYIARVGWPIISSYWWIRKYAKHPEKYTMEEKYGRLRKYYYITLDGKKRLESFKNEWKEVISIYNFVMKGVEENA